MATPITDNLTYKERLQADYERIRTATKAGSLPLEQRMQAIEEATDAYLTAHAEDYDARVRKAVDAGRAPGTVAIPFKDDRMLHAFADLVMYEDLTWSHPDKMSIVEYPVMSDRQAKTRGRKEAIMGELLYGDRRSIGRKKTSFTDDYGAPQVRNNKLYGFNR